MSVGIYAFTIYPSARHVIYLDPFLSQGQANTVRCGSPDCRIPDGASSTPISTGTLNSFSRFYKLSGQRDFDDGLDTLPATFLKPAKLLEQARIILIACYMKAEAGTEFDEAACASVHADFTGLMEQAEAASQNVQLFSLKRMLYDAKLAEPVEDNGRVVDAGHRPSRKQAKDENVNNRLYSTSFEDFCTYQCCICSWCSA
jgi:hypothetical protein